MDIAKGTLRPKNASHIAIEIYVPGIDVLVAEQARGSSGHGLAGIGWSLDVRDGPLADRVEVSGTLKDHASPSVPRVCSGERAPARIRPSLMFRRTAGGTCQISNSTER